MTIRWKAESNVNTLGTDHRAPKGSQQSEPSDEELAAMEEARKQEAKEKQLAEKATKKENSNDGGEVTNEDDPNDFDEDGAEGDGEDADADDSDSEEGDDEEVEEEGDETSDDGEATDDSEEDPEEEEEGDAEEEEGEDEAEASAAVASSVGERRIFRGEASHHIMHQILSAFPGTGKSHLFGTGFESLKIADSDSSTFDEDQFPYNYADHIHQARLTHDLCLISSHAAVRSELKARGLNYLLVYPARSCKEEYLARYLKRGSPASFVQRMDENWDSFIDSCEQDSSPCVVLQPGQYLGDVVNRILE